MMDRENADFVAAELAKTEIDWKGIDSRSQEAGKPLSDFVFRMEDDYGYSVEETFLVVVDRAFSDVNKLLAVLDPEIVEDVVEYARSIRKDSPKNALDKFAI